MNVQWAGHVLTMWVGPVDSWSNPGRCRGRVGWANGPSRRQAPLRVREAIEQKLEREQQVASEQFQTQIIQERARQQAEEAKGIAEAQQIITQGLTPEYLTFFYIQQLSEMPDGSVVYVPTEGGIPLIRTLGGGR